MSKETDWENVRRDFPVTQRAAYLNSAAAGPVPLSVMEASAGFYREMMKEGDAHWDGWLARREEIRERVARFINAAPDEIAFTINTSSGMNVIVDALEGCGEVISCDLEFPVTTLPWMHRGMPVHLLKTKDGELRAEDVRRAMNERTAIIAVSQVQFSNGFRVDVEELGRSKGRRALVVNASQSAGVFEIDVKRMKIDALCATGHKWMLSGYGIGFVYLSRELLAQTRARAIGWLSVKQPYMMRNDFVEVRDDAASRAELGCPHFAGIFALGAAVDYLSQPGMLEIERRALALNQLLTSRLSEAGWEILSPLRDEQARSAQTLVAAADPRRLVSQLAERGIAVTEKPQGIRVATHFFNNESDLEQLMQALKEIRN